MCCIYDIANIYILKFEFFILFKMAPEVLPFLIPTKKTPSQQLGCLMGVLPGISNCKAQTSPVVTVVGANFRKTIFEPLAHGPFPFPFFSGSWGWGAWCKTSDRCHRVLAVGSDRQIRCVDLGCMMFVIYAHLCVLSKLSTGRLNMF